MKTQATRFDRLSGLSRAAILVGVLLALILLLFAAAEGFVRYRSWAKYGQATFRIEDTYKFDEQTGLRLPQPDYKTSRLTINSLGFRSPEIALKKPPGRYRIAFLGASTTYCAEVSSDEKTWPALVVASLNAAGEKKKVEQINASVPGFTVHDSLRRFDAQVKRLRPDLVVIYHATNDLSYFSRGAARKAGVLRNWGQQEFFWLSRWSMLSYLVEKNIRIKILQANVADGSNKLKVDPASLARPFEKNLRALVRDVKATGARVVLVTFALRLRRSMGPEARKAAAVTSLYYMPYMTPEMLLDSFDAYNNAIRAVAKEEKTTLIEAAAAIPADSRHFVDSVHFTDRGAEAMAAVVFKSLRGIIR